MNTLFLADLIELFICETEISILQFPENSKLKILSIRANIVKINLTKILTLEEVGCSDNQEVIVNAGVQTYDENNKRVYFDEQGRRLGEDGNLIQ